MFEFLKDGFEALGQRIRSPFIGSIALVFIAVNWKPLVYVAFSEKTLEDRFLFFDCNTSANSLYYIPVLLGILLALLAPWLKFVGAYIAKFPKEMLDKLQHDEAQAQRIYEIEQSEKEESAEAKLEATRERRKIDAAKRLEEAKSIDNDVERELVKDREQEQKAKSEIEEQEEIVEIDIAAQIASRLSVDSQQLLMLAFKDPSGRIRLIDNGSFAEIRTNNRGLKEEGRKRYLELNDGMEELIAFEILVGSKNDAQMTRFGYQVAEVLAES